MRKTILLDLDNTLLGNDMATFLPPYFAALQKRMNPLVADQDLPRAMFAAVQAMQANRDPTVTNYAAFMADFTKRIGLSAAQIQPVMDAFYREAYPRLKQYTTFRPAAPAVVQHLLRVGHQVVIATNPLFVATAITQRLDWAGLSDFSYTLITHMENSHFSKPDPGYYQEILTKTGSRAETTWMVGDDPINDMAPARTAGLKTWWITDTADAKRTVDCDARGALAEFLSWIEAGNLGDGD